MTAAATASPPPGSLRTLIRLAVPIVAVSIGMTLMGTVDTLMVGRVSAEALAAVAIGNVYFFALAMFALGITLGLDPVITQALGADDHDGVALGMQRGLILAALLTVPLMALLLVAEPVAAFLHQPTAVVPLVGTYCRILAPSAFPFLAFSVGRQSLQAMHRVAPLVWTIAVTNLLNIGLNQWLIFGGLGVPALGVAGSAWATTISRTVMAVMVFWLARRDLHHPLRPWRRESFHLGPLGRLFRLGLPIGLQFEIEFGTFGAVGLMMGSFGTTQVAGHQVALSLASLTFMVPMSVGMAAAVMVGRAVGRIDPLALRGAVRASLVTGVGFMTCTALLFLVLPRFLAGLYTDDVGVVEFAALLLPIAGVFQVFDGLQVVSAGILRGLGDTRAPMLINLVGFVAIGMTASVLLAFRTSLGPVGLWWGLVLGLASVALILLLRVRTAVRRPLRRVVA